MKTVNIVFPDGVPWTVGLGWAHDLKLMGMLGVAVAAKTGQEQQIVQTLKSSPADLTLFVFGDTHLSFLIDTDSKAEQIKSIPGRKICLCWEVIRESRFGNENPDLALRAYDIFGWSNEVDLDYFLAEFPTKNHFFCPFAASSNAFTERPLTFKQKKLKVLFYGKFTTFGLSDEIYSERREMLKKLRNKSWFVASQNIDTSSSPTLLRRAISEHAYCIHLPSNNHFGFQPRAFEILAAGSVMLHPQVDEFKSPRSNSVLTPNIHYLPYEYDARFPEIIEDAIFGIQIDRYHQMVSDSISHVQKFHSIASRINQIIQFAF